jgi:hypothetical protein
MDRPDLLGCVAHESVLECVIVAVVAARYHGPALKPAGRYGEEEKGQWVS